jgi:hypothetical protein
MTTETLHETFTRRLPDLETLALAHFRVLNPEARDEAIQNTTALAWKHWVRLAETGRAADEGLLGSVWWYAVKQTRVGRTITRGDGKRGQSRHDVYDRPHGTTVDHTNFDHFISPTTPVPDQVAFRLDLPAFLDTLSERQRGMAADLAAGMTTTKVARKHGVTPGAVSQFRTRFKLLFDNFYAEAA